MAVLQLLKGDAAQRVLRFAAMERPEAQQASGTNRMTPYSMIGMLDEYDAIRLIAELAYKSIPNQEPIELNFITLRTVQTTLMVEKLKQVCETQRFQSNAALLIDNNGKLDSNRLFKIMRGRNRRTVMLQE